MFSIAFSSLVRPRRGKPSPGLRREESQSCSQTHRSCACAEPERISTYHAPWHAQCAACVPDAPRVRQYAVRGPTKFKLGQAGQYSGHHSACGVGRVDALS